MYTFKFITTPVPVRLLWTREMTEGNRRICPECVYLYTLHATKVKHTHKQNRKMFLRLLTKGIIIHIFIPQGYKGAFHSRLFTCARSFQQFRVLHFYFHPSLIWNKKLLLLILIVHTTSGKLNLQAHTKKCEIWVRKTTFLLKLVSTWAFYLVVAVLTTSTISYGVAIKQRRLREFTLVHSSSNSQQRRWSTHYLKKFSFLSSRFHLSFNSTK